MGDLGGDPKLSTSPVEVLVGQRPWSRRKRGVVADVETVVYLLSVATHGLQAVSPQPLLAYGGPLLHGVASPALRDRR